MDRQIIAVLREHEAGARVGDVVHKHGVSEAMQYNWKAKYGGMDVSDAKRLKALEDETGGRRNCSPTRCAGEIATEEYTGIRPSPIARSNIPVPETKIQRYVTRAKSTVPPTNNDEEHLFVPIDS
jgi:hypothetical protein